ncbi:MULTISPECIES: HNH endonuclease [Corynebacterium]|uniref:HNH endonuclease n=1 Tax=Corynebacterium TaxID=1716 RepID=UPI0011CA119B|nr:MULTISPECIES: HNH endonuclease [Corynebacterium]TXS64613.1 HNH endonuclease [Corynebacterium sp. LK14]HAT1303620.1 HNH endonuclease [Corynebacterium striatum]HAT1360275.1 HNH endonuclease [Corynebacterium striatum]HAT1392321.1 HNH endonuclease [Corynebacterium striatum]
MAQDKWTGRAALKLRRQYLTQCQAQNLPCWLCGQPIDYQAPAGTTNAFEPDHYHPRADHPELALDPDNLRPAHASCNRSRGKKDIPLPLGNHSATW